MTRDPARDDASRVAAVVTAAGSGSRLGRELPKALVPLHGRPLVVHAVLGLLDSGVVDDVVVTVPAGQEPAFADALALLPDGARVRSVPGGATRQASVAAGLRAVADDVTVVLVHDAARCLTPPDVVVRVVDAVRSGAPAVVPVVPLADSVVRVAPVVEHVDRSGLRAVQTPQGFARPVLDEAHAAAASRAASDATAATDDASLCAALGVAVATVPGHRDADKITTERDLALAHVVLRERRAEGRR